MRHSSFLVDDYTQLFVDVHSLEDGSVRIVLEHYEANNMSKTDWNPAATILTLTVSEWQAFKEKLPRFIKWFEDGLNHCSYIVPDGSLKADLNRSVNDGCYVLCINISNLSQPIILSLKNVQRLNNTVFQYPIDGMAKLLDGNPQDPKYHLSYYI